MMSVVSASARNLGAQALGERDVALARVGAAHRLAGCASSPTAAAGARARRPRRTRGARRSRRRACPSGAGSCSGSARCRGRRRAGAAARRSRSAPPTGRSRPHELTFWPSSVISRTPSAASASTSETSVASDRDCSRPRTDGTMQYEQVELQPIEICTHAWCARSRRAGRSPANSSNVEKWPARQLAARADEVAEPRDVARPEGQIDERVALEQLVLHRLGPAAADDDRALGMLLLGRARLHQVRDEAARRPSRGSCTC